MFKETEHLTSRGDLISGAVSIWTCRETQDFSRFCHGRPILKNIELSGFFHAETLGGSRWELWIMEHFLRV